MFTYLICDRESHIQGIPETETGWKWVETFLASTDEEAQRVFKRSVYVESQGKHPQLFKQIKAE